MSSTTVLSLPKDTPEDVKGFMLSSGFKPDDQEWFESFGDLSTIPSSWSYELRDIVWVAGERLATEDASEDAWELKAADLAPLAEAESRLESMPEVRALTCLDSGLDDGDVYERWHRYISGTRSVVRHDGTTPVATRTNVPPASITLRGTEKAESLATSVTCTSIDQTVHTSAIACDHDYDDAAVSWIETVEDPDLAMRRLVSLSEAFADTGEVGRAMLRVLVRDLPEAMGLLRSLGRPAAAAKAAGVDVLVLRTSW